MPAYRNPVQRQSFVQASQRQRTRQRPAVPAGGTAVQPDYGGGGFTLPDVGSALGNLRGLQMQATSGLADLMRADPNAMRNAFQESLYASQADAINRQADLTQRGLLEGTFARGVGQSTIGADLQSRLEQQRLDALARASREAYNLAGQESRADLASRQGLYGLGFNLGTTGLQAEANVGLANLAREQQAQQFAQNLAFQQSQAEANRALAAQQFADQLAQRQAEFTGGQAFTGGQNELNRAMAMQQFLQQLGQRQAEFTGGQAFTGEQNALNRAMAMQQFMDQLQQRQAEFTGGQGFTAEQAALNRALQSGQFGANLGLQQSQLAQQAEQFAQNLAFRRAQLAAQMGAQDDALYRGMFAQALPAAITGLGQFFEPTVRAGADVMNAWLRERLGI